MLLHSPVVALVPTRPLFLPIGAIAILPLLASLLPPGIPSQCENGAVGVVVRLGTVPAAPAVSASAVGPGGPVVELLEAAPHGFEAEHDLQQLAIVSAYLFTGQVVKGVVQTS